MILAINHTAGVDPMAIYATCTHRLASFVVAREYYHLPVLGWFQRLAACVPVDRKRPGRSFFSSSLRLLRDGGCLAIFPEGTWAEPGEPPPEAKAGIGHLALRSGATVIPCHISGTKYAYSPFRSYFLRHDIRVRYGRPIDLSPLIARQREGDVAREASELIMSRIRALGAEAERDHG